MITYVADERISARQALKHPYFKDIRESEKPSRMIMSPASLRTTETDTAGAEEEKRDE